MTRRSVLAFLATLPGIAFLTQQPQQSIIGPMTLERERSMSSRGVKVRVLVDGVDVTNRCQYADDTPGHQVARLLQHHGGKCFIDRRTGEIARETITRGVEIRLERKA